MQKESQKLSQIEDLQKLKLIQERQDQEAQQNWSRNNILLIVMSVLILAFGQTTVGSVSQLAAFRILLSVLGVSISAVWLLMQYRSSQYIKHYKQKARDLQGSTGVDLYPTNLAGFETRKLSYLLPIAFILIWLAFFSVVVINIAFPSSIA